MEGIHVDSSVDTSVSESSHAAIMVSVGVYMVDTNGVGAKRLHQGGILLALLSVH